MNKKIYLFFILIIFFSSEYLYSQKQLNFSNSLSDFGLGNYDVGSRNFLEVSYGFGHLKDKDLTINLKPHSITEISFGKRYVKAAAGYSLLKFEDNYIFSSYVNDNQSDADRALNISYKIYRFGLGYRKGYGYSIGNFALFPSFQLGLVWNQSSIEIPDVRMMDGNGPLFPENDIKILKKYRNTIKFGTTNIAGLDLKISSLINIGAGYETEVIYPAYLVWKHFGSFFIEILSQTGIDFFTDGVLIRAAPSITPILYFVLKNGLSYLFYTFKQKDMNWPFDTANPLTIETLKFDLRFSF